MAKSLVPQTVVPTALEVFDVGHRDILAHLDKLTALVSVLEADPDQNTRSQARELFAFFTGPAREHNYDEERHVFPTLLQCAVEEVKRAVETVCEDHAWIELSWLEIEPQLAALIDGDLSLDGRALRSAVEVFDAVMRDHIALEEPLLHPQLRGHLKSTVVRSISREMEARRETKPNRQPR